MLKSDQLLWERELAEHMAQYRDDPTLRNQVPGASRRTRRTRQDWMSTLLLWTPVAVVGGTVGWSIGWYMI